MLEIARFYGIIIAMFYRVIPRPIFMPGMGATRLS